MSFVIAVPELVTDAATSLASLGSTISAAYAAAAAPTTGMLAAGADEVSAAITTLLSEQASAFQALTAQAAAFHVQLVQTLNAGAGAYAATEAANAGPLQILEQNAQILEQNILGALNGPTELALGRPLIGDGFDGTTNAQGIGTPGGAGGILWGTGGHGGNSTVTSGVPGGAGGPAGLIGTGGTGGMGGWGAPGGTGGTGGWLWGNGGIGGVGGPLSIGGAGGSALLFGNGGPGGTGGELAQGGAGGAGGLLIGNGGPGGTGGVLLGTGGPGGNAGLLGVHGAVGAAGGPATVGLEMFGGGPSPTRPGIAVSVNGGQPYLAFIDTGSTTTLLPPAALNGASLGNPIQTGLTYNFGPGGVPALDTVTTYNTYTAQLNFGNGIITKPMTIGVITGEAKGTGQVIPQSDWEGVLGVGANTTSANFPNSFVQELPGPLGQGLLINEPKNYFQFGPNPLPTTSPSVSGAPLTNQLQLSITTPTDTTGFQAAGQSNIDTGGNYGDVPQALLPPSLANTPTGSYLPQGTVIKVQIPTGSGFQLLYTQTVGANGLNAPAVTSDFVTGNYVFSQMPIYMSYSPIGVGTTFFGNPT